MGRRGGTGASDSRITAATGCVLRTEGVLMKTEWLERLVAVGAGTLAYLLAASLLTIDAFLLVGTGRRPAAEAPAAERAWGHAT